MASPSAHHAIPPQFVAELEASLSKDKVRSDAAALRPFQVNRVSYHPGGAPDLVLLPGSEEDVVIIAKLCNKYSVPVIAYGNGTSLEGHTTALNGGVMINFENMDRVIKLNDKDLDCVVEPGLSFLTLNRVLAKFGLWFPLDAGPNATIGGMTNTNASGTKAVRYGPMRDNVLSLRVVLADGRVIKTGQRARKTSAGYDLTHLFIGSEGTLGIVTQITLKLRRIPEKTVAALCHFPRVEDAASCVMEMIQRDILIGMCEFLDEPMMRATNLHYKFTYPERPTLYFEFSGNSALQLSEQENLVRTISQKYGGSDFVFSKNEQERQDLWRARKAALFASKELRPGSEVWTTDACVPMSRLAEAIVRTKTDLATSFLPAPIVGHVGDGNYHLFILLDPKKPEEVKEAHRINENLVRMAIEMEGTCTGEHGVGIGKRAHLPHELGEEAVELMRQIKATLDPKNILNPGKVLPPRPQAKL